MKLSIITINYNNAEGLRKTLASVASQTYADIEHVIVDGGSTDGSVEIIREYVCANGAQGGGSQTCRTGQTSRTKVCHQIRWISEPDKGIYNAMNKGLEVALGKRVVNDDHTSSPHRLIASSPLAYSPPGAATSLGILRSPRGDRLTPTTFGPSGRQLRLNCCVKKRRINTPSQCSITSSVYWSSNAKLAI